MKKLMLLLSVLLLGIQELVAQCSSCKAAAASTDSSGELVIGAGLNTGILFLLSLPFLGFGLIVAIWYVKQKQLNLENEALEG